MTTPAQVEVHDDTKNILDALAHGDPDLLATGLELRADWRAKSGLDGRSYALVKLAALIALDDLPDGGGRRGVQCDERGQLDQRIATAVETALGPPVGPQLQAGGQQVGVAVGQPVQDVLGVVVDLYLDWRGHVRNSSLYSRWLISVRSVLRSRVLPPEAGRSARSARGAVAG